MSIFLEAINWWYSVVALNFFNERVLGTFIFSMNKTRALPFARTFSQPLYKDNTDFGKTFGVFIKFWWISLGTFISIFKVVIPLIIFVIVVILPLLPIIGLVKFFFKI